MKKRLAIIGTGITGMSCAHFLRRHFDIQVYEKNNGIGGHTHTVFIQDGKVSVPVDMGFLTFNETTYPLLTRLFNELDVTTQSSSISFSAQNRDVDMEFSVSGLNGIFAQRGQFFRFKHHRFLYFIYKFKKESPEVLTQERYRTMTVRDYLAEKGWNEDFLNFYLIPMSSAIWFSDPKKILDFPIKFLVQFFQNNGFLGFGTKLPWRITSGGSRVYKNKLVAPFREKILVNCGAVSVKRTGKASETRVTVVDAYGKATDFDSVIFACHADQALDCLDRPHQLEKQILSKFRYQKSYAVLHTDESFMPQRKRAWASWNYRYETIQDEPLVSTTHWMNSLQNLTTQKNYFVTLFFHRKWIDQIDPSRRIQVIEFEHPIFDVDTASAQQELTSLNEKGPIYFCGSYFGHGSHEDGLSSAYEVCKHILNGEDPWPRSGGG